MVGVRHCKYTLEVVENPFIAWVDQHTEKLPRLPIIHQLLPIDLVMKFESHVLINVWHPQ